MPTPLPFEIIHVSKKELLAEDKNIKRCSDLRLTSPTMGTEVLRSQDCLKGRLHLVAFGSRPPPPRKPNRKRSPGPFYTSSPSPPPASPTLSPPAATKPPRRNSAARSSPPLKAKPPRLHRKSPSPGSGSNSDGEILPIPRRVPLVMEEIRILRRGEEFKPSSATSSSAGGERMASECCDSALLCSTDRIGPEPEILPKKMGFSGSIYAGPAFSSSPSPSSLPIPGFFVKKANCGAFKGDEATRALRVFLRLDDLC